MVANGPRRIGILTRSRSLAALLLAALTVLFGSAEPASASPTSASNSSASNSSASTTSATAASGPALAGVSPVGARQVATAAFDRDTAAAVTTVQDYWRSYFASQDVPFRPVRRVFGYTTGSRYSCAHHPLAANNAEYCPSSDFIAYHRPFAVRMYNRIGNAFVFLLIGHEYGHAIQWRLHQVPALSIQRELQADCLAGAYIGDSVRSGVLVLEKGDVKALRTGLTVLGDSPGTPWFSPVAHGTGAQRVSAFNAGYVHSLDAC
jgi:predicted metalloprotease